MRMARQGDVLLVAYDGPVPAAAVVVERDAGRVVLAYGEMTGHAHALIAPGARLLEWAVPGADSMRVLDVPATGAVVEHEEHGTITLDPGLWLVKRQREYAPEATRNVAD